MTTPEVLGVALPKDVQSMLTDAETLGVTEGVVQGAMRTFRQELAEEEAVHEGLSSLDYAELDRVRSTVSTYLASADARVSAMCDELDTMHTAMADIIGKNNALIRHSGELQEYLEGLTRLDIAGSKRRIMQKIKDIQLLLVAENRVGQNSAVRYYDPSLSQAETPDQVVVHVRVGSVDGNSLTLFESANPHLFTSRIFEGRATLVVDTDAQHLPENTDQWPVAYVSTTGADFERTTRDTGLYNLQLHRDGGFVKMSLYGMVGRVEPGDELFVCLALEEVSSFHTPVTRLF
jgi:hypothetical protein